MSYAKIQLKAQGVSKTMVVNNADISDLVGDVYLDLKPGDVPRIGITFLEPDIEFDGEGVVVVNREVPQDPRELILGFLNAVDAGAIEARVLEGGDLETGPGVSFIDALKELVR